MSVPVVRNILDYLQTIAPFETAEDFDNVGLLLGNANANVTTILCTLDVTMDTVREAQKLGAQLIVSHHPLMFHARKNLQEGTPEADVICEMIRSRIALISAHTNLDQTVHSGSACAARALGLTEIHQSGYLFIGHLPKPLSAKELGLQIKTVLHAPLRIFGSPEKTIKTLAIAGGAYGEGYLEAMEAGAQAYLTGEIRHHEAIDAAARGMVMYEGGHYATEAILILELCQCLQNALNALQYEVRVYSSACTPYIGALE